jgi:hypothetical protein
MTDGRVIAVLGAIYTSVQAVRWNFVGLAALVLPTILLITLLPVSDERRLRWDERIQGSAAWSAPKVVLCVLFLGALWFIADILQHLVDLRVDFFILLQSLALLGVAFSPASRRIRPLASVVAIVIVLAAEAFVAVMPIWFPLEQDWVAAWKFANAASLGILLIAVGLCDHFTRVRLLRHGVPNDRRS